MRRAAVALTLALAAACAPGYRQDETPRTSPPGPTGEVVVGHVRPDGTLAVDTLAAGTADTARVERETVLTGTIRPRGGDGAALETGWRVQVLATPDRAIAERYAGGLGPLVDGAPVYVEWVDPWWKVRVGDFVAREPAERLRDRLAAQGVAEAWTVRTTIRTVP